MEEHRQRLSKLDELLQGIGTELSPAEDSEFRRRQAFLRIKIKALFDDCERAVGLGSSSMLVLGDLQVRNGVRSEPDGNASRFGFRCILDDLLYLMDTITYDGHR